MAMADEALDMAQGAGVDVVVGGDSHTLLGPDTLKARGVGNPAGSYPTRLTDKDGKTVCVVQVWEYAQVVGELKVSFDERGDVQSCTGTPHVLIGDNFTMDIHDALVAADFVQVDKVIGMHYDTFPYIKIDHAEVKEVAQMAGKELILMEIGQTINL